MDKTLIKPTIILGLIGFVSALTLSHINKLTKPEIVKRLNQKKEEAYAVVLPPRLGYVIVEKDKKVTIDGKEFIYTCAEKVTNDIKMKAYAFETAQRGYSGIIRTIVAVDENMKILGISILHQTETPGLGARVKEVLSKETFFSHFFGTGSQEEEQNYQSWFEQQFTGIDCSKQILISKKGEFASASEEYKKGLLEKNAVSAITGATITTKAVVDSIAAGAAKLMKALELENKAADTNTGKSSVLKEGIQK